MADNRQSVRKAVNDCFARPDLESALDCMREMPPGKAVAPLLAALCSADDSVMWRAVSLLGAAVAGLAEQDMEAARTVMRRLMWSNNDESGGIGWGAAESMAEAMVHSEDLAREFAHVLVSFIAPEGHYLDHVPLQRGAVWGVGRLARVRPEFLEDAEEYLVPLLGAGDAEVRALAAWALEPLATKSSVDGLSALAGDETRILVYWEGDYLERSAGHMARAALQSASMNKGG